MTTSTAAAAVTVAAVVAVAAVATAPTFAAGAAAVTASTSPSSVLVLGLLVLVLCPDSPRGPLGSGPKGVLALGALTGFAQEPVHCNLKVGEGVPHDAGVAVHKVEELDVLQVHHQRRAGRVGLDDDVEQDVEQVIRGQIHVLCGVTTRQECTHASTHDEHPGGTTGVGTC